MVPGRRSFRLAPHSHTVSSAGLRELLRDWESTEEGFLSSSLPILGATIAAGGAATGSPRPARVRVAHLGGEPSFDLRIWLKAAACLVRRAGMQRRAGLPFILVRSIRDESGTGTGTGTGTLRSA